MHGVRVPVSQTQSAGPVRTAHMSVLLTVNIVSQSSRGTLRKQILNINKYYAGLMHAVEDDDKK